jgi:CRISPR-associated protein Csm1
VVEFAFDVYQSFRAFTGWHPDITLSGGITISGPKYPLYQSADDSGKAEAAAKQNGRDSLGLFGEEFKWAEWLGTEGKSVSQIEAISSELKTYVGKDATLQLFGIFPFVVLLHQALNERYPASFVRNLLSTAQLQEQQIVKAQKERPGDVKDIQYFLHLPKVAYTLARLPPEVKNSHRFNDIRTSLKSPYNAPYFRAIATWIELLNRK